MSAAERVAGPAADMAQARAFLARLGAAHTFQTFDDTPQHRLGLARILHGNLTQHSATLARLNAAGAGIFVMVNGGDGQGRKAANVQQVRACFADLDGAPLAPVRTFALPPHIVVESSPGRWHAYWLTEDMPLERFKPMQQAIARQFDADPKVCDLPRVMRLPGFFHCKGEPFLSRVIEQHDGAPYPRAAMVEAFGLALPDTAPAIARRTLAAIIPKGERNSALFGLARGLVCSGLDPAAVNQRLQKINAERCQPPLCATEVDTIAANASAYGSNGFAMLPHALLDSPAWKSLPPASVPVVVAAYRQLNSHNNGNIALPWPDFKGQHGIERPTTFYRYVACVVDAGVLIRTGGGKMTQRGKQPARFAIAAEFLPRPHRTESVTSASHAESAPKKINRLEAVEAPAVLGTERKAP
ncbi:MAG: primase C-terminal domain-containing protein [Xanthomonadaceae bacterium]|nr:primase C-terminal domain-containing protein [Xanthomonadaceae bacterium]MDE3071837.1 primase C-terminal domain-containing protein [Pseudomonadota bacterium]